MYGQSKAVAMPWALGASGERERERYFAYIGIVPTNELTPSHVVTKIRAASRISVVGGGIDTRAVASE